MAQVEPGNQLPQPHIHGGIYQIKRAKCLFYCFPHRFAEIEGLNSYWKRKKKYSSVLILQFVMVRKADTSREWSQTLDNKKHMVIFFFCRTPTSEKEEVTCHGQKLKAGGVTGVNCSCLRKVTIEMTV